MTLFMRPHHALCIILFSESGHSKPYISIMREHIAKLSTDPKTNVILCSHLDEICGYCPHNNNYTCGKSEEVDVSDSKILERCGLEYGIESTWEDLRMKLIDHILRKNILMDVCAGCMYLARCEEEIRN